MLCISAFGCAKKNQLNSLCKYIAGDANLYTMFRIDGSSIKCPFADPEGNPYQFSYDRGRGECKDPPSELETCTDQSKINFNYKACPNVPGSELTSKSISKNAAKYFYFLKCIFKIESHIVSVKGDLIDQA